MDACRLARLWGEAGAQKGRSDWEQSGKSNGKTDRGRSFARLRLAATGVAFLLIAASWLLVAARSLADDDDDDDNATFTVDNPPKADCPTAQYTTIQSAVSAATSMAGATIRVCAGTYPENVVITSRLNLRGDGPTKVFVTGAPSSAGPIIGVSGAVRVVVRGMTVDGQSQMVGGVVYGIRFTDTSGIIRDMHVLNVRDSSGIAQGIAIRVEGGSSSPQVKVEDNLIRNYVRVGILANAAMGPLEVRIEENEIFGPNPLSANAPNGIQVSRGASGRVEENKVSGATVAPGNPGAGVGSGILLFCAGPTRLKENRVTTSDVGIALADNAGATVSRNRVEDSVFDAYSLQFGLTSLFGPLGCPGSIPSFTKNNVLRDNRARDSGENGISLVSFDVNFPDQPKDNTVSKNDIRYSGIDGIAVFNGEDNHFLKNRVRDSGSDGIHVFDGADNRFQENRIRGSGGFDAHDETTGGGTGGTADKWKDNECDTSSPSGLCEEEEDDDSNSYGTRSGSGDFFSGGGSIDWHSFGTEQKAKDPKDPNNDVALINTTDPENDFGAVTRDLDAKVADLTGHLSVDYYIAAEEVDLPLGGHLVINRGCGGGPPRYELAVDLDGDGSFDGDAVGYIGPAPTFTGCAQNAWQHQDLTDDGLRWNLVELGGLPLNTWAGVLAFFEGHPSHRVQGATLVDDAMLLPIWAGLDYFDNIEIGDETMTRGL